MIKKTYLSFIVLYIFLISLSVIAFVFMPYPASYPEGFFITPGNAQTEWIFAIVMPGLTGTISGLIAIYLIYPLFIGLYLKFISKKNKIGYAQDEKLSSSKLFRRIWARSFILGFFVGNICFTLAGQESIVEFMRSVSPSEPYSIPDIETLWQIAWLITIPSTFIVIPVYAINDAGIVAAKKIDGFQITSANLAGKPLYKVIKGFAGIGFLYNLIIMIIFWVTQSMQIGGFQMTMIIQIISPLIAAGSAFPGVLILEYLKPYIKKRVEKVLVKLDLNYDIANNIELKSRL